MSQHIGGSFCFFKKKILAKKVKNESNKKNKNAKSNSNHHRNHGFGSNGNRRYNNWDYYTSITTPLSEINEILRLQRDIIINNFSSSELTYNGSDKLIFIIDGEPIKNDWKRILYKNNYWNQYDARNFFSSTLVI